MALREHIVSLRFDDGSGPFDDELEWLRSTMNRQKAHLGTLYLPQL